MRAEAAVAVPSLFTSLTLSPCAQPGPSTVARVIRIVCRMPLPRLMAYPRLGGTHGQLKKNGTVTEFGAASGLGLTVSRDLLHTIGKKLRLTQPSRATFEVMLAPVNGK
jgi:hypothetical protein